MPPRALIHLDPWKKQATVCAWCPEDSRRNVEHAAFRMGYAISHGICSECRPAFDLPPSHPGSPLTDADLHLT